MEVLKTMTIIADTSFGTDNLTSLKPNACPVKECNEEPTQIGKLKVCPKHGLEIHKSTFVYYNGEGLEDKKKSRLRNILPFGRDFVAKHILDNPHKAESYRLGSENSEDARAGRGKLDSDISGKAAL